MLIFGIRTAALPLTWQALWVGKKKKKLITIILVVANPLVYTIVSLKWIWILEIWRDSLFVLLQLNNSSCLLLPKRKKLTQSAELRQGCRFSQHDLTTFF